jgi:hypothetical protein
MMPMKVYCLLLADCCKCVPVCSYNLSISNFSILDCSFFIFNKPLFLFSSYHLNVLNDGVVPVAGWCVSRIFYYVSLCSSCVVCDG